MPQKDLVLLKKVKESDKNAFKELFFSYHDTLFRFVLYKIQDDDIAEDITQETFFRVWNTRHKLKPNKAFFSLCNIRGKKLKYLYTKVSILF